ncbi:MAG TPA: hypothetical protein VGL40_08245 [Bacillota bacterium]
MTAVARPGDPPLAEAPSLHEYTGAIHVHSTYSDGRGTVPGIITAAAAAGLDFVVLTDHDSLAGKRYEGWHGGVLLLVGQEVSPEKEHYLAFGLDEVVPAVLGGSDRYVAAVASKGGFGFIAHPFDRGSALFGVPSYEWRPALRWADEPGAPMPDGLFTGLEVWNFYSEALGYGRNWPAVLRALLFPGFFGPTPDPRSLALWDALGRRRAVPAIGGLDAHGEHGTVFGRPLRAMTYGFAFRTLRTNVLLEAPLTGAPAEDCSTVLGALRRGRSLIVLANQGPSKGARFWGRRPGEAGRSDPPGGREPGPGPGPGRLVLPGDEVAEGPLELNFTVPAAARLAIRRDGAVVSEVSGTRLCARVEAPGVYRAEARRRRGSWHPWIYSNPIYLRR